jgi:hypothetical protein
MAEEVKTLLPEDEGKNFIHNFIDEDIAEGGQFQGLTVHTRFPPEPNGYLHIGHCKAICVDFGTAEKYNGLCNLRMDDTNPAKEDTEYVDTIERDIRWLGFKWGQIYYASDYFDALYMSYKVGMMKPDPMFFRKVLMDEKILAEETLFVDDGPRNVAAASQRGIRTFCPVNGADWTKEIYQYLT